MQKLCVVKLGTVDYQMALELQLRLLRLRQQKVTEDILLLLEHPPVITAGVKGKESNILVNEEFLMAKNINVYRTNRGGDVTYHGPGQIVGYPILDLDYHGKDLNQYARRLEETFIRLLKEEYDICAARNPGYPGVWIGNDKIIAMGIAVKRWVTMHGFAFNVNTNLEHFRFINPCGLTGKGVTSLKKLLGSPQDLEMNMQHIIKHFSALFQSEPEIVEKEVFLHKIEELSDEYTQTGLA